MDLPNIILLVALGIILTWMAIGITFPEGKRATSKFYKRFYTASKKYK